MLNSFSGVGRLELDPMLLKTPNGKDYAKMIISIPRAKSQDGKTQKDRINVDVWGKLYDAARWCHAGDVIAIEGSLQVNNYKNQSGEWISSWAINAHSIDILQRNVDVVHAAQPQPAAQPTPPAPPPVMDIPAPAEPPPETLPFFIPEW